MTFATFVTQKVSLLQTFYLTHLGFLESGWQKPPDVERKYIEGAGRGGLDLLLKCLRSAGERCVAAADRIRSASYSAENSQSVTEVSEWKIGGWV